MKDPLSYTKAKTDWAGAQAAAIRRCSNDKARRAYLQIQAARITHNVNEMERLEQHDAFFTNTKPAGRWPYA